MGKKIKCACGAEADVKMTRQREGAQRRMKPVPFIACPACGSQYSSSKARIAWIEANQYDAPAASDIPPTGETENVPPLSDTTNTPPPKKGGLFSGWSTIV